MSGPSGGSTPHRTADGSPIIGAVIVDGDGSDGETDEATANAALSSSLAAAAPGGASMVINRITVAAKPTLAERIGLAYPAFTRGLEAWFATPEEDNRTPAQLEAEKYMLRAPWSGPFKRWMIVLPTFLVQLCIGSLYSWSIFNSTMDGVWGTLGANAQAFTIAIACALPIVVHLLTHTQPHAPRPPPTPQARA